MWAKISGICRRSGEESPLEGKEIKNVAVITIAFQLVYTGFYALQNLHSSLHDEDNLGLVCLSVLYGTGIISSMLSPTIIGVFGVKPVLVTAFAAHSVYILANFYASFASMVPGAIFLGAFFGPAWTSQGVYVSACSFSYSKTASSSPFSVLSRFNGFFFAVMASTQLVGNVFTSLVIRDGIGNDSEVLVFKYCGPKDCPAFENATEIQDVQPWVINITLSVFMALSLCGLLLLFLTLTPLPRSEWVKEISPKQMTATFIQLLFTPNMAMLVPFMIFTGMEHAFLMGSFTKSYISCPIGIHMVGFVMAAYGITTPIFFLIFSKLVRVTGRFLLLTSSSVLYLVLLIFLLHWEPREEDALVVFLVPVMWGIAESIQQAQANALIALMFADQKEAAFANFHAWRSLGYCVTFLNVAYLCVSDKILICIVCLVVGSGLYIFVEIKNKVKENDGIKATPANGTHLSLAIVDDEDDDDGVDGYEQTNTLKASQSVASFRSIQERLSFSHHELCEIIKDAESCWRRDSKGSITLRVDKVMSEEHLRESKVTTLFHARPASSALTLKAGCGGGEGGRCSLRRQNLLHRSSHSLTRSQSASQFDAYNNPRNCGRHDRQPRAKKSFVRATSSSEAKQSSTQNNLSSERADHVNYYPPRRVFSLHAKLNHGYESDEEINHGCDAVSIRMDNSDDDNISSLNTDGEKGAESIELESYGAHGRSKFASEGDDDKDNRDLTETYLGRSNSSSPVILDMNGDNAHSTQEHNDWESGNSSNPASPKTKSPSSDTDHFSLIQKMNKRLSKKKDSIKKKTKTMTRSNSGEKMSKSRSINKMSKKFTSNSKKNKNGKVVDKTTNPTLRERRNVTPPPNLKIDKNTDNKDSGTIMERGGGSKVGFYLSSPSLSPNEHWDYTFPVHSVHTNVIAEDEEEFDNHYDEDSDGFVDIDEEEIPAGLDGYDDINQIPLNTDNADTISIY